MSEAFRLREEVDRYTARLVAGIRHRRRRERVRAECAEHLYDRIEELTLGGTSPEAAFSLVRREMGDEGALAEVLTAVHKHRRLPSWLTPLVVLVGLALLFASYFIIEYRPYRSWLLLLGEIGLGILLILGGLCLLRLLSGYRIRRRSFRRLAAYAEERGFTLSQSAGLYTSLVRRTTAPELILDTGRRRYILYHFSTLRKRRTLRLLEGGLYSYTKHFGYLLYTRITRHIGPAYALFWPKHIKAPSLIHSEIVDVPRGLHLFPSVEWEANERRGVKNIRVLLLNPIPMRIVGVERGIERRLGDDTHFGGMHIFSMTGFLSYLEGERIAGKE